MEVFTIKGENVILMYHAADEAAEVGQQFAILECPNNAEGLVVQVISNDSLEYPGLQQEIIQKILEERATRTNVVLNREQGMGQIRNIKLALAKIRKRIRNGHWQRWDGWIPTRSVDILPIKADDLIRNIISSPTVRLKSFCRFQGCDIQFNGPSLNMVNVITGVKGSGKSHIAKHLLLALASANVPCIVFDINGEYVELPNVQVLKWGDNFIPELAQTGYDILIRVQQAVYPLKETSEAVFLSRIKKAFEDRKKYLEDRKQDFSIDIEYLRSLTWSNQEMIQGAILRMLEIIDEKNLFLNAENRRCNPITNFKEVFDVAARGKPIVFDIRDLESSLQSALVKSIHDMIEKICIEEFNSGKGRFPFVFYEEAHFYVRDDVILNIITRGRHIGIGSIFITNTPQKLPDTVFRQLDNLFLLNLTHKDDIRNVSKNSFTDEDTIESFATRLPERHALIVGNLTDRYPLVVEILDLPTGVPPTGRTRSTWDRFTQTSAAAQEENP